MWKSSMAAERGESVGMSMVRGPRGPKKTATHQLSKAQTLQIIASVCQKYGCEIVKMDFDRHILDLEGTEDAKLKCTEELHAFLD
jgi:hypothetical protein